MKVIYTHNKVTFFVRPGFYNFFYDNDFFEEIADVIKRNSLLSVFSLSGIAKVD